MKELNFTKGMPVERVKPLALLDHIKACGAGEKRVEESSISALDPRGKMQWRRELLIRYAHKLLEHSDAIFADNRLFLAPVPIYGTTPLGVVIDWWQNYRCSMVRDCYGCLFPIYGWDCGPYKKMGHLCNADHRRGVYYIADGVGYFTPTESVKGLSESLQEVCRRYDVVASINGVFDLEDAIELLLGEKVYDRC